MLSGPLGAKRWSDRLSVAAGGRGSRSVEAQLASAIGAGQLFVEAAVEEAGQNLDGASQVALPVLHSPLSTSKAALGITTCRWRWKRGF